MPSIGDGDGTIVEVEKGGLHLQYLVLLQGIAYFANVFERIAGVGPFIMVAECYGSRVIVGILIQNVERLIGQEAMNGGSIRKFAGKFEQLIFVPVPAIGYPAGEGRQLGAFIGGVVSSCSRSVRKGNCLLY